MNLSRRSVLTGLIAAPLVVRTPGLIMPVRSWHAGIRGQIGWVVENVPVDPFPPFNNHSGDPHFDRYFRAVISDGRRWHPLMSRRDLARPGDWVSCLVGSAPVDGPAAICA